MMNIARINVSKTSYTCDNTARAKLVSACQFVSILKKTTSICLVDKSVAKTTITKMMQTMTSMMIIMPSMGGR
ncbi:hypothetical protein [Glaciecola sp. MF2-115]|uniref:hypothetical protein n=1 Tax=Glaciecola sp. MF2-115 TaxID=3384827 RepID=UPI0039A29DE1